MFTLIGFIIIVSVIVAIATIIGIIYYSGFNPFNFPGVIYGAYKGFIKSSLSLLAVIAVWLGSISVLKAIGWALFGYSLAVISPPVEMIFTMPLSNWLSSFMSVSWAMMIAYGIVALGAGLYIILFWFVLKDII